MFVHVISCTCYVFVCYVFEHKWFACYVFDSTCFKICLYSKNVFFSEFDENVIIFENGFSSDFDGRLFMKMFFFSDFDAIF